MYREQVSHEEVNILSPEPLTLMPFSLALSRHGLKLNRATTHTLQVNVGFLCNQTCRHCHLSAGPGRKEDMDLETAEKWLNPNLAE